MQLSNVIRFLRRAAGMFRGALVIGITLSLIVQIRAEDYSKVQLDRMENRIVRIIEGLELHKTDASQIADTGWQLRSKHFVFGMPRLVDRRHDFAPEGDKTKRSGISVLVREGFVVAHFDRMRTPLYVCQRWSRADYHRMKQTERVRRDWKEDLELPIYARAGTSYDYESTNLQRGHMARHEDNHAWGTDNAKLGCHMSNSAPQHRNVNTGAAWRALEEAVQAVVVDRSEIEVIWTISGTLYRGATENNFDDIVFIGGGFGRPLATYKIVAWFDRQGRFQARAYLFDQSDKDPKPDPDPRKHIVPIDEIEKRGGVDFFPLLKDYIEDLIEKQSPDNMWGAE